MVFKLGTKKHAITNTLLYSTVVCIALYAAIHLYGQQMAPVIKHNFKWQNPNVLLFSI